MTTTAVRQVTQAEIILRLAHGALLDCSCGGKVEVTEVEVCEVAKKGQRPKTKYRCGGRCSACRKDADHSWEE